MQLNHIRFLINKLQNVDKVVPKHDHRLYTERQILEQQLELVEEPLQLRRLALLKKAKQQIVTMKHFAFATTTQFSTWIAAVCKEITELTSAADERAAAKDEAAKLAASLLKAAGGIQGSPYNHRFPSFPIYTPPPQTHVQSLSDYYQTFWPN